MIIKNTTVLNILKALKEINKKYEDNIKIDSIIDYSSISNNTTKFKVNLLIKDTNKKGARIQLLNTIPNHTDIACFHVHYDFFNTLLNIDSNIVILTCIDWIIKKNSAGEIIGNPKELNKFSMHKIKPHSFLCRCK